MDISNDGEARILIGTTGLSAPTPGHEATLGPLPTPTGQPPGEQLQLVAATARLSALGFEVGARSPERQVVVGDATLQWTWTIQAEETGDKVISFVVELEYRDTKGVAYNAHGEYSPTVEVGESLLSIGQLNVTALLTGMVGSGLSFPFLYSLWKDRRAARRAAADEAPPPSSQKTSRRSRPKRK